MHEFVRDPMTGINRERSKLGSSGSNRNIGSENSISSRTKSIAGTLEYMAPEIIIMLGKRTVHEDGYTAAVDYWSLGVLLYKLLTGDEPYKKMSYSTVQALLPSHLACHSTYSESFAALFGTVNLEVCEGVLTMNSRHLIMSLLAFNAEDRLGSNIADMKAGHNALMTHPFFSGIDWTLLECKQVPPPYIPHDEILETVNDAHDQPPKTLCDILQEANKYHWCEEYDVMSLAGAAPSTRSSQRGIHIIPEDQYYFRMWHYVSPELLDVHANMK